MSPIATEKSADAILVIDGLAKRYAAKRSDLADRVQAYEEALRRLQITWAPVIKERAAKAAEAQGELEAEIRGRPDLFIKPRTMTLHGIKLGFQKGKGVIDWADDEKLAERIEKNHPEQYDVLVKTTHKPIAKALAALSVADLRKLGCQVEETGDAVYIKAADTEIDKLVARLLDEGSKVES